jgi:hypothetical protein
MFRRLGQYVSMMFIQSIYISTVYMNFYETIQFFREGGLGATGRGVKTQNKCLTETLTNNFQYQSQLS